ncbi:AI-2E family transporter [Lacihabitans sp. CCS-44]|uniref:AI-2E family transporter n=1 Tax=Lacihabitans sp. CCS-44 TaxID=2487331 RepID=UPI0020CE7155|nr:AI-2E family transporter [Lacihabitans sp. CCS-44]MCP9753668.1 AI-2E family transporter [Lacihabitans sp. CCS-44]
MTKRQGLFPIQNAAFALVILVIVVYALYILKDIFIPFIIAGLLSFLLFPISRFLEKYHFPRPLAILLSIVVALSILGSIIYFSYTQIIQLESLIPLIEKKGTVWITAIEKLLRRNLHINQNQLVAESQKYMTEVLKNSTKLIGQTLSTTSGFLINLSLLPLYIFLFLLYRDFLKTFVYKLMRNSSKHTISNTINKINGVVRNYIVGLLLVILIVGILNTGALYFLEIEHALFFGFFASFLVLIPYIGIAIGSALPILVALITKDSYWYPAGVAASFFVIQFLEGNFITPMIVGNKVSINSLAAIMSLLLFGNLWGISGLVLALPLTAIIKVIFDSSDSLKAWGFLLGDSDHIDVQVTKKHFSFKGLGK